ADAWLLVVETIVAAGLVAVIRGGARQADTVVAAGLETERRIRAAEARRADEREQHRQLHDTVLSTLTMVAAGAFAGPSPALTAQAARDLSVLRGLADAPPGPGAAAPLADLTPALERAVAGGAGRAVVEVTDRGRGFDPGATPPSRRGIRESITGRMEAAGGRAAIASRPGAGTTVTVSWPA